MVSKTLTAQKCEKQKVYLKRKFHILQPLIQPPLAYTTFIGFPKYTTNRKFNTMYTFYIHTSLEDQLNHPKQKRFSSSEKSYFSERLKNYIYK